MNMVFTLADGTVHRIPGVRRIDTETHDGFTVVVDDHPRNPTSTVSVGAGIVNPQRVGGETAAVFALLDNAARLANAISHDETLDEFNARKRAASAPDLSLGDHFAGMPAKLRS